MRPDLIVRRDLLAGRVLNRIGPGGLIHAPGTSRVLESALLLALLTNEDLLPEQAELTRRYLKNTLAHDPPDPLQHCFAQAALGDTVAADQAVEAALSPFRHFSSERKMLTFRTLLHEVAGSTAARHRLPPDTYEVGDQQVWLSMQMCALKAMTAPEEATDADWTRLAPALRPGPAWQANHLARLIALFALRKHPAHRPAVRGTLVRIAAEQLPGGGVPFVTGLDVFATAVAGLALARVRPRDPRLTAMADALAAHQNPDGGLGFTTGVTQSDIDDTSYTLEFLRAVTPGRHGEAITRAERYLLDQQNTDGGFPSFVRGTPSEIAMTAGAVNALAPSHRRAAERGVAFLVAAGPVEERSWSRNATNAAFRTTLACGTLTGDAPASLRSAARNTQRRCRARLAETQETDGGWGHEPGGPSDPISTAYAVIALSGAPGHTAVLGRALAYLLDRQQDDGGFSSRPDQAGPRPLLHDIPALADVNVLLGLSFV